MSKRPAHPLRRGAPLAAGLVTAAVAARWLSAASSPGAAYLAGAPLLIAHRGGSGLAPENTLLAFRQAVEWWGADVIELDVQPTRDGEAVVLHDATVDRTTDGAGPSVSFTLAQLRELDAAYRFSPDGGKTFPYRGRGVALCTFEEAVAAFPFHRINVEIKDGRAQQRVREVVEAAGASQRVLIAAEALANRSYFSRYAGPISASREEMRQFFVHHRLHLAPLYRPRVDALQMPLRHRGREVVTERLVRDAHARNMAVHVWTVDDANEMRLLLDRGVDGIVTDRPDRLARVLHERVGRPLPPGPPAPDRAAFLERLLRA